MTTKFKTYPKYKPSGIDPEGKQASNGAGDYLENSAKQAPLDRRSRHLMGQAKVREYEKQIDQLVYELYGLTKDEIRIVEGD